ncbi:MAG: hypothetical protein ABR542_10830 [Desulfonatronovibrio sp.]
MHELAGKTLILSGASRGIGNSPCPAVVFRAWPAAWRNLGCARSDFIDAIPLGQATEISPISRGSDTAATLGWGTESRWDSQKKITGRNA